MLQGGLMIITLSMPQFGESITKGRIIRWLKKEGEAVKEAEPLIEMETEKTVFAYESPFKGKLSKIIGQEDTELEVGNELAQFEVSEEDGKKYVSLGVAKEVGVSLRAGAKQSPVSTQEMATPSGLAMTGKTGVKMIPVSPIRSRIADNMVASKSKIPHAGTGLDVVLPTLEGFFPKVIFAAIQAIKDHPLINSVWKEEGGKRTIEQYDYVNLGIATAAEQGLIVPVIRHAEKLSLEELTKEITRVTEEGRKGKLSPQEMSGGTFTINNTGALGATRSTQVIPPHQSAILAINRVVKRPWVVGDQIVIKHILSLDLAFDHRLIDGEEAIGYLVSIKDKLEN